jgi:hypothetical protein
MTETVTNTAPPAGELEHLRELVCDLGEALTHLTTEVGQLRSRVKALEADTPQARQLQYEADLAAADLAESGYGEPS